MTKTYKKEGRLRRRIQFGRDIPSNIVIMSRSKLCQFSLEISAAVSYKLNIEQQQSSSDGKVKRMKTWSFHLMTDAELCYKNKNGRFKNFSLKLNFSMDWNEQYINE